MPPISTYPRKLRALGAGLLAAAACGDGGVPAGDYLALDQRLAAQTTRERTPILHDAPTASIGGDTRYVLAAPRFAVLIPSLALAPDASASPLQLEPALPASWREVSTVLLLPQLLLDTNTTDLPPRVVAVEHTSSGAVARFELGIPEFERGMNPQLAVFGYALEPVDLVSQRSAEIDIPAKARLDFAIGLVEPRFGFDPVEFEIRACRAGHCRRLFRERLDPRDEQGPGWRERRISLAELAGTRQQLVFETRRKSERAPYSLPVWANPTVQAVKPRPAEPVNVILISLDTLRADHLTPYGYHRDTSPFMAELFGERGALFENFVASATFTTPSHASIFTSLQPRTHQMTDGMRQLPLDVATLAESARHGGIATGAITENGWISVNFGFGRGFDSFRETKDASPMLATGHVDATFRAARAWLRRHRDEHFFLFLHTYQTHSPYAPPARYARLFREHDGRRLDESSPAHLREMADYDREIRYTDDELRVLFECLEDLGLGEDTVVIVTSDHGEAFLERGLLEHNGFLTEEIVRVPLMLWGRGIPAGRRIETPASHVDLMPTILELLGLRAPVLRQGSSLLAIVRDRGSDSALEGRALFSESPTPWALGPGRSLVPFSAPATMVRQGKRKLARYSTAEGVEYRYYDLADDPGEGLDLHPTHAAQAADLRALLDRYPEDSAALRAAIAAEAGGPTEAPRSPHLDPRQQEKLRALGYLQ